MQLPEFYYQKQRIKKILIIGLGVSGRSVVEFLRPYQIDIAGFDQNQSIPGIKCYQSWQKIDLDDYDLLVAAPGIPINKAPFNKLYRYWGKVIGDIELFAEIIAREHNASIVAVTGSNGKTTVASLLHYVLNQAGIKAALVGNIGTPVFQMISDQIEIYVLEISSFQIDLLKSARFSIGCVLNISEDHLDRYPDFSAYRDAKLSLLAHSHCALMNHQDCLKNNIALPASSVYFFNNTKNYIDNNTVIFNNKALLRESELKLKGRHNLENILAVVCLLEVLGLDYQSFLPYFRQFEGLQHRCQKLQKINGTQFINDSKATNIGAVIAAIQSIAAGKNIVLLFGGLTKGACFDKLLPILERHVSFVCIYGQDCYIIEQAIKYTTKYIVTDNLTTAFNQALQIAKAGDIVLLSPGCSSFDEFSGYQARGEHFMQLVQNLKG